MIEVGSKGPFQVVAWTASPPSEVNRKAKSDLGLQIIRTHGFVF